MTRLSFSLFLFLGAIMNVEAVLQSIELDVVVGDDNIQQQRYTMLASQAFFGPLPKMNPSSQNPVLTLEITNDLFCSDNGDDDSTSSDYTHYDANTIVMVPRGECTFEQKVWHAQQRGAAAVLIYGTTASRYSLNKTAHVNDTDYEYTYEDIVWPGDKFDYDCTKGHMFVEKDGLSFDPLPYNAEQNDPILTSVACPCRACLLTGNGTIPDGSSKTMMQACCAWDLPIWLYNDPQRPATENNTIAIPAAYLTMEQAAQLKQQRTQHPVTIVMYSRWRPWLNCSSILIWALGVFVAALAAYLTASDYRHFTHKLLARQQQQQSLQRSSSSRSSNQAATLRPIRPHLPPPDEILELTAAHALGFIIMASASLLILFYFQIYNVVKVVYAFGCSSAFAQVVVLPIVSKIMKTAGWSNVVVWDTETEDFGVITLRDVVSFGIGFMVGMAWLLLAFWATKPDEIAFFWITQNIFGACMCIMFMKVIRLNSIHVAAILLIVAFFYDIFFVFVTPLLFKGKSVMITVATSGGPPKADALWCEKYPSDHDCQGGDPLPMLLTIPRFFDYQGGSSLLGLGDIVLPGLLISFAARLDAAKSLLGVLGGGSGRTAATCPEQRFFGGGCGLCNGGYFVPLVIAYAVGLLMANTAVYLMEMGQPALLYLVPCCLGTMAYIGWRRHELKEIWLGPKALRAADTAIYGEEYMSSTTSDAGGHAPLPVEEGGTLAPAAPSAVDGDVALVEDGRS